ncbi:hypothetical protein IFU40_05610 [Microbacterium sp. CFBP 13617]|uniref:hypothetical protein n=1 Tax=Microbacterium sp. CFBP 13617 TaxID=2774035 RepID=UPI00177AA8CC|nr:hypothetical protein [Microbacterium sp. CFBP 13617]MBD8218113.1 hypothetical protein [Microbacterium sp. CFBP 13617]
MTPAEVDALVTALLTNLPAVTQADRDDLPRRLADASGQPLANVLDPAPVARVSALAELYPADAAVRRRLARRLAVLRFPLAVSVADAIAEQERDAELDALA